MCELGEDVGLSPAAGTVGLVLRAQGPGPGRLGTPSTGSCPCGQQCPHWRVTFLHLGPKGT